MIKKSLILAAGLVVAASSFAADSKGVEKVYELTDGSKVFLFEGAKWAWKISTDILPG